MKVNDTVLGAIITVFSVIGFIYVHSLGFTSQVGLSPGVFPQLLFVLMALCGIAIFFEGRSGDEENTPINVNWEKLVLIIATMTVYTYTLEYVGFIISTIAFLGVTLYIFEEKRLKILASVPVLSAFAIYYSFTEFFLIPLP